MAATSIEPRRRVEGDAAGERRTGGDRRGLPRWDETATHAQRPRVIVIDERRLIVDALAMLIATSGRFEVIPRLAHEVDATAISVIGPDVAVLGVSATHDRPLRMLEALHLLAPEIKTVIVADAQDPELIRCVLDNSVGALLLTGATAADLAVTLDQVLRGQTALPAGWQAVLSNPQEDPVSALSQRQLEVLRLLADGRTYEEIAVELVITTNTVKFHVRSIYMRLGVSNRIGARKLLEAHEPRHTHAPGTALMGG